MPDIPVGQIIDLGAARDQLLEMLYANGRLPPAPQVGWNPPKENA